MDCEVETGLRDGEVRRLSENHNATNKLPKALNALEVGKPVLPGPALRLGPDCGTSKRKREGAAAADGMTNEAAKKGVTEHYHYRSSLASYRHFTDRKWRRGSLMGSQIRVKEHNSEEDHNDWGEWTAFWGALVRIIPRYTAEQMKPAVPQIEIGEDTAPATIDNVQKATEDEAAAESSEFSGQDDEYSAVAFKWGTGVNVESDGEMHWLAEEDFAGWETERFWRHSIRGA
ncbi:hypothetical protein BKA63DRAFT_609296 [Paraphoma chrysanthemicola]|nr:hypothetical protein BKA63DRAFT_609296 [Paraphoma chrysanthemicola]